MRKNKILVYNPYLNLYKRGITTYGQEYTEFFLKKGFQVKVLALPNFVEKLPKVFIFPLHILYQQILLPFYALINKCGVVFDVNNSYSIIGSFVTKYCYVIHDFTPLRMQKNRFSTYYLKLLYYFSKFFSVYPMAITRDISIEARDYYKINCYYILENLVILPSDDKVDNNFYKQLIGSGDFSDTCVVVSGPGEHKDFSTFLKYVSLSTRKVKYIVIGFGVSKTEFIGNSEVIFLPWISNNELYSVYKGATFSVFHSGYEGFGRPIIELLNFSNSLLVSGFFPSLRRVVDWDKNILIYDSFESFTRNMDVLLNGNGPNASLVRYEVPDDFIKFIEGENDNK